MNYELAQRVHASLSGNTTAQLKGNGNVPSITYQDQKASSQKMSTYKSTPTDNLKHQGVGITATGTKPNVVKYKGAGNPNRSYPVSVVNKALSKIGGH